MSVLIPLTGKSRTHQRAVADKDYRAAYFSGEVHAPPLLLFLVT